MSYQQIKPFDIGPNWVLSKIWSYFNNLKLFVLSSLISSIFIHAKQRHATQWRLYLYGHSHFRFLVVCYKGSLMLYSSKHCRYLVICHPMKAQSISTPDRTKKIIAVIWVTAISLSSVAASHFNGVRYLHSCAIYNSTVYQFIYTCCSQFKYE